MVWHTWLLNILGHEHDGMIRWIGVGKMRYMMISCRYRELAVPGEKSSYSRGVYRIHFNEVYLRSIQWLGLALQPSIVKSLTHTDHYYACNSFLFCLGVNNREGVLCRSRDTLRFRVEIYSTLFKVLKLLGLCISMSHAV